MNDLTSKSFKESLDEAINLFNNQKWYEAHDAFEDIWNDLIGDERQIVQGILQISVSQFHLNKGNLNGAMILIGEGLGRIRNRVSEDLEINICKTKQLTNMRSAGAEELDTLQSPIEITLERALEYIGPVSYTHLTLPTSHLV